MVDSGEDVNMGAYMDFKEATDSLFNRIDHEALAKALGVSVASIRQARLRSGAGAYRNPPNGWQAGVVKLARECAQHYQRLAEVLALDIRRESDCSNSYLQPKHHDKSIA